MPNYQESFFYGYEKIGVLGFFAIVVFGLGGVYFWTWGIALNDPNRVVLGAGMMIGGMGSVFIFGIWKWAIEANAYDWAELIIYDESNKPKRPSIGWQKHDSITNPRERSIISEHLAKIDYELLKLTGHPRFFFERIFNSDVSDVRGQTDLVMLAPFNQTMQPYSANYDVAGGYPRKTLKKTIIGGYLIGWRDATGPYVLNSTEKFFERLKLRKYPQRVSAKVPMVFVTFSPHIARNRQLMLQVPLLPRELARQNMALIQQVDAHDRDTQIRILEEENDQLDIDTARRYNMFWGQTPMLGEGGTRRKLGSSKFIALIAVTLIIGVVTLMFLGGFIVFTPTASPIG